MLLNDLVLFCSVMLSLWLLCLMNQGRTKGEGWSTKTSSNPQVIFIAGRPKAALLLWFFGDFRCGALLFVVIHVIYINIKIGKNSC